MKYGIKRLKAVGIWTLLVVAATLGAALSARGQDKPAVATWSSLEGLGISGVGRPAVARDQTERLQVFARAPTFVRFHSLWQLRQSGRSTPPFWSAWKFLGGVHEGDPVVGKNADGRLEVFSRGPGGTLQHIWQLPGSPYGVVLMSSQIKINN